MSRGTDGQVEVVIILDPGAPERLVAECVRRVSASRRVRPYVRLADPEAEPPGAPAGGRFVLELPWFAGLDRSSLPRLVDLADHRSADLINVLLPGARDAATPIRLWRSGAVVEAQQRRSGVHWAAGTSFGIVDLRCPPVRPVSALLVRVGWLARDRMPAPAYAWLAPRVKNARQRVRNYLFLD